MKETNLIVLRGPSGSGKSSVAKAIQKKQLDQDKMTAYIEQDHFRRVVLKERDVVGGFNIQLIKKSVLFLLQNQYDVILEGIFDKGRYEGMFKEIVRCHPSHNYFFYFNISFAETLRRHNTKPQSNEFGEKEMRAWYKREDLLENIEKNMITENLSFKDIVQYVQITTNL